ncbi:TIGR04282 family arsenosugar biosynthesis glycosyltransferase [Geobacter sp. DSM 9736]|uniref:TIGR04282 family arsenosugar biosynthesis glycosyltransferase n=1 Tax=Geobacter sp. DSM 9736 TaxID=1277350 RepID=UPI000B604916|nr:TIGR04282 family arsenosugar biosynthesis glycosyltransferase [Geobacter sp. DSM 9736]SNB47926.1 hypothetical protein SAMN06269301_3420 [Geobacter sp. DSM 9736]
MKESLIIFAKHPRPGRVKTRLTPALLPEEAAELYRCMLLDTLELVKPMRRQSVLFFEPDIDACSYFEEVAPELERMAQRGKDLGERMEDAFRQIFDRGSMAAAIIGTDSPHLPRHYLEEAFLLLKDDAVDAVFGPATDGGYYLLAMKTLHRELFCGIAWSSSSVLKKTIEKATAAGIRFALLPEWHDLDTAEDLLRPELLDERNGARMTREFILRALRSDQNSL